MERARKANSELIDYTTSGQSGQGTGGFECVIPCLKSESGVEKGVGEMLRHYDILHNNVDDIVLRKWIETESEFQVESETKTNSENESETKPQVAEDRAQKTVGSSFLVSECEKCQLSFCVVPISTSREGMVFETQCAPDFFPCEHELHDFYEATRIKKEECQLLELKNVASDTDTSAFVSSMVAQSGIAYNSTKSERDGFQFWCENILTGSNVPMSFGDLVKFEHLRLLCNENRLIDGLDGLDGEESVEYLKKRAGMIDLRNGDGDGEGSIELQKFIQHNFPCIIRGGGERGYSGVEGWGPAQLKSRFNDNSVNVLIFDGDGEITATQNKIMQAEVTFGEFVDMALGGFESEEDLEFADPIIYLLLTNRGLEGNVAVNPNPNSKTLDLLAEADQQFNKEIVMDLATAWSNLRMGAGYDYPTHIDCYENIISQLYGQKVVKLASPSTINAWQPNLNHKHWPQTTKSQREEEYKNLLNDSSLQDVKLEAGDSLYVPIM